METVIRPAELLDDESVHTYYCNLLKERIPYIRDNPEPTKKQEAEFIRGFVEGPGILFLAIHDSKVIGMMGIERSSHYQECHRINIGISIEKEYRRQGLGTKLLNTAKIWASENAVSSIELEVISINPAVSLYKQHDFNEIGRVSNGFKVDDNYYDVLYMQHTL